MAVHFAQANTTHLHLHKQRKHNASNSKQVFVITALDLVKNI